MASITSIIGDGGLKTGDAMRDIKGDAIADSVVVGPSAWAMIDDGSLTIERHAVISGETTRIEIGHEGAAALGRLLGPDEVHCVVVDGETVSQHRTLEGAAKGATDHMNACRARVGALSIDDEDVVLIDAVLRSKRRLNLQVHRGLDGSVPGMDINRLTLLAMGLSRDYSIRSAALLD